MLRGESIHAARGGLLRPAGAEAQFHAVGAHTFINPAADSEPSAWPRDRLGSPQNGEPTASGQSAAGASYSRRSASSFE